MKTRSLPLFASVITLLLVLAGCGGGGENSQDELTGDVRIDGSSTVYPITEAVAEEFMMEHPNVRVTVGVSGTGGGFAKFLRGESDINDASRPITPGEKETADANGISFIELPVAFDGLAIVTNPENEWLDCITVEELKTLWEPNSAVDSWDDLRPGFPAEPVKLYGPGTDSGTYDYFTSTIVGEEGASRSDYTASEDDNVLVQGISGDRDALGYFGMAYYEENASKLKLVGVDNGSGCVEPNQETVRTGEYNPLARPEFIYVHSESVNKPAVDAFVRFYLDNAAVLTKDVGYVPLSDGLYDLVRQRYANRTTGTLFHGSQSGVDLQSILAPDSAAVAPRADSSAAE